MHSFVAIGLLNFLFIFIAQESSQYFDFKNNPYVKIILFYFCVYDNASQKHSPFVYKFRLQGLPSARDNIHVFIHTKIKKLRKNLYTTIQTLCKKQNICVMYLYTKILTLFVTQFSCNFWNFLRGGRHFYL